jgi:hypothetical protein
MQSVSRVLVIDTRVILHKAFRVQVVNGTLCVYFI